ncbi:UDP-glycosyltransferase 83A1-like isoform X2 [Mangifera indica]|uniref:UDP-glycosyltransferase 83A1-like isoform X2 n=1 Tax=Mangifera indica TaxID=29780 RepID=UPI001CF9AC8F|nr:UDP-glycosyltransferase 83A1-like isoform X2 [Mangifera indica]
MSRPHILAVPYPAQGHVIPLLGLSRHLVKHGCRVTFINTEHTHSRVINGLQEKSCIGDENEIRFLSIPDGLEPREDRNDLSKVYDKIIQVMSEKLQELVEKINREEDEKIFCLILDGCAGFTIPVAEKMKIKKVAFWPPAVASLALFNNIPKLIDDGIIRTDGTPIKKQIIQLAQNMPGIDCTKLIWTSVGGEDLASQKRMFEVINNCVQAGQAADYLICNSAYDLEPGAFALVPNILPIGPLLASNGQGNSAGSFWPEDSACLEWLDQQQPKSVIYVAFGSFTILDKTQFQELALGLELTDRPFLWVVRPDITDEPNEAYPGGFQDRVARRSRLVGWAPQQKVLSHPSIACFFSHCGWNSTLEGVSNGVPFLCWPYFADQFIDESYICDVWKVGLKLNKNENGIITREEIKSKVDQVLGDESFKARVVELQESALKSVKEGGQSHRNFKNFIEWIKA